MKYIFFLSLLIINNLYSKTLSVQNTSSTCGQSNVPVYINIDDATGLLAFQFDLYFDKTKIDFISASNTSLTSNFWVQHNDFGSYVKIAAASGIPVESGSGAICVLYFNVIAANDGSSNLDLQNSLVNDVPPTNVDGTFTITNCCNDPSNFSNNSVYDLDPCSDTGVVINWSEPSNWGDLGGSRYFVVLRDGIDISSNLPSSTHSFIDTTGTNGTTYLYQVKAINGCGRSATTAGTNGIDNVLTIPSCSTNPYPPDGSTDVSTSLVLSWSSSADASSYDVYFGTESSPPYLSNTSNNFYNLSNLNPETNYFWKIIPKNSCGSSSGCLVWTFKTGKKSLSCSAEANPTSGTAPLLVNFSSSGSGGVEPYSYFWDFGDGSTSTEQNPKHTYSAKGTYNWSFLLKDSENTSCAKNGTINVNQFQYSKFFLIPAGAHSSGGYGSYWKTNLSICNFSNSNQNLNIALFKAGQDNTNPQNFDLFLEKNKCNGFDDIFWEKFSFEGAGAIRISSNSKDIMIDSRTFDDNPGGTFGQFIPAFNKDELLKEGEVGYIRFLIKDQNYRTNIGFSSLSENSIDIRLEIYSSDGIKIGEKTINLPPFSFIQLNDVLGEFSKNLKYGFAVVSSSSPNAFYTSYASVVDNKSNDPIFVPVKKL